MPGVVVVLDEIVVEVAAWDRHVPRLAVASVLCEEGRKDLLLGESLRLALALPDAGVAARAQLDVLAMELEVLSEEPGTSGRTGTRPRRRRPT